jgi:hypothetical protein
LAAIAVAAIAFSSRAAQASEDAARTLQSRHWWIGYNFNIGGKPFGNLYMFGTNSRPIGDGWYTGQRVQYRGAQWAGEGIRTGIAWKPVSGGVIISDSARQETIRFVRIYPQYEAIQITGSFSNVMCSTRSPLCPDSIRRHYWK